MKIVALIPSLAPDEKLVKLTKQLEKDKIDIVIVNDGSEEKYDEIFKQCSGHVISYRENKGKGYALKKGLKYIDEKYKEAYIITMDSDGQHTTKDAYKLCDVLKENKSALVLGKRIRNEKMPLRSTMGNRITRFVFRTFTGVDVYDTQTGLRAFTKELIPFMLKTNGDRFEYEMNVLLDATKEKIEIIEVPIETIYIENNKGSHYKVFRDSYMIYKQIFNFKFKRK